MSESEPMSLDDWLASRTDRFEKRKKFLFFSSLVYKPTGERVEEGFRYFRCDMAEILRAFDARDVTAFESLPFAVDDDGDPDTSAVCLLISYTKSGAFLALQPQEYQNYRPTLLREPLLFEGADASAWREVPARLDQTY